MAYEGDTMWRRLGAVLIVIAAAAAMSPAFAQIRPKISVDGGTVIINRKAAVQFRSGNGSLSPENRASITAQRLINFAASGLDPNSIAAKGSRSQARVIAGDILICIATAADAKAAGTTPIGLAQSWGRNVKSLLLLPPIVTEPGFLLVPLGENRRMEVGGAAAGPIYAKAENPGVAAVSIGTDGPYVVVQGCRVGDTTVEISVEGERAKVRVAVRKYAGRTPNVSTMEVTGNPCPAELVRYAAGQAAAQNAFVEPGAKIEVGSAEALGGALGLDQCRRITVPVKISGPGYITLNSQAVVEVKNVFMPRETVDELFYSNSPERLEKYKTLFAARLKHDESTRVLYHHQNVMDKRVQLIVELINPSDSPARMRILRGVSNPRIDTVLVGQIAANEFLRSFHNNVSIIESIPARSRLVLVSDFMDRKKTASGILQVRQLSGEDVYVRITAAEPWVDNVSTGTIAAAPNPLMLELSDHVYPSPSRDLEAMYRVGELWAFIPIGKHALDDSQQQKKLYGNYGVTYNISVKVENPTCETKKVRVIFDPTAGLASGVFIIDGKFILAKNVQPPLEVSLASYSLKPGEVRDVKITTVPLAGSNYPATLVVRS